MEIYIKSDTEEACPNKTGSYHEIRTVISTVLVMISTAKMVAERPSYFD